MTESWKMIVVHWRNSKRNGKGTKNKRVQHIPLRHAELTKLLQELLTGP